MTETWQMPFHFSKGIWETTDLPSLSGKHMEAIPENVIDRWKKSLVEIVMGHDDLKEGKVLQCWSRETGVPNKWGQGSIWVPGDSRVPGTEPCPLHQARLLLPGGCSHCLPHKCSVVAAWGAHCAAREKCEGAEVGGTEWCLLACSCHYWVTGQCIDG